MPTYRYVHRSFVLLLWSTVLFAVHGQRTVYADSGARSSTDCGDEGKPCATISAALTTLRTLSAPSDPRPTLVLKSSRTKPFACEAGGFPVDGALGLNIVGSGPSRATIDCAQSGRGFVFTPIGDQPDARLNVSNVEILNARAASGACIHAVGRVDVRNCGFIGAQSNYTSTEDTKDETKGAAAVEVLVHAPALARSRTQRDCIVSFVDTDFTGNTNNETQRWGATLRMYVGPAYTAAPTKFTTPFVAPDFIFDNVTFLSNVGQSTVLLDLQAHTQFANFSFANSRIKDSIVTAREHTDQQTFGALGIGVGASKLLEGGLTPMQNASISITNSHFENCVVAGWEASDFRASKCATTECAWNKVPAPNTFCRGGLGANGNKTAASRDRVCQIFGGAVSVQFESTTELSNSMIQVVGSSFEDNEAVQGGGGIGIDFGADATQNEIYVARSAFTRNSALQGGAFAIRTGQGIALKSVDFIFDSSTFQHCNAVGMMWYPPKSSGGAIYWQTNGHMINSSISFVGGSFEGNSAVQGGAVAISTATGVAIQQSSIMMAGVHFEKNIAVQNQCPGYATEANGGAVAVAFSGPVSETNISLTNLRFQANSATVQTGNALGSGGALFFSTSAAAALTQSQLHIDGCLFVQNTAGNDHGGAIMANLNADARVNNFVVSNSVFQRNMAAHGGALSFFTKMTPSPQCTGNIIGFYNSTFTSNTALTGNGGALAVQLDLSVSNHYLVRGCHFIGNECGNGGGAYYMHFVNSKDDDVTMQSSTFSNNSAKKLGGALALSNSNSAISPQMMFQKIAISNNSVRGGLDQSRGGGMYIGMPTNSNGTEITLLEVSVISNSVSGNGASGGGISFITPRDEPLSSSLGFTCTKPNWESSVDKNLNLCPYAKVIEANERAYTFKTEILMTNVTISANTATGLQYGASAGGVEFGQGGKVVCDGLHVVGNTAKSFGSGLHVTGTVSMQASNSIVRDNSCESGTSCSALTGAQIYGSDAQRIVFTGRSQIAMGDEFNSIQVTGATNVGISQNAVTCPAGRFVSRKYIDGTYASMPTWSITRSSEAGEKCQCYFNYFGNDTLHPSVKTQHLAMSCSSCPAGRYSSAGAQTSCIQCGNYTFQSSAGQRTCAKCPCGKHAPSINASTYCQNCPDSFISSAGDQCTKCPTYGVKCTNGFITQDEGWWHASSFGLNGCRGSETTDSGKVQLRIDGSLLYRCPYPLACHGSAGANLPNATPAFDRQCSLGYTGPVCAICEKGYTFQFGQCLQCDGFKLSRVIGVILICCFIIGLVLYAHCKRKTGASRLNLYEPVELKIALSFFEMVAILNDTFDIQWPRGFSTASSLVRAALANMSEFAALSCGRVDRFTQLKIFTFGVLIIVAIFIVLYKRDVHRADTEQQVAWQICFRRCFYLGYFVYPLVSPVVMSIFQCRTVQYPGSKITKFLIADYNLTCSGHDYNFAFAWSVIWALGFVFGFPAALVWALYWQKKYVAFLLRPYKALGIAGIWDVVDVVRKLLLSSIILFLPSTSARLSLAILVSAISVILCCWHKPYAHNPHNWLEVGADVALFLMYFAGAVTEMNSSTGQLVVFETIWIIIMVLIALGVILSVRSVRRDNRIGRGSEQVSNPLKPTIELSPTQQVSNPAYDMHSADDTVIEQAPATDSSEASAESGPGARVAQLEEQLEHMKRTRAAYASARVASELEKAQQAHTTQLESLAQKHAAEIAKLRAELRSGERMTTDSDTEEHSNNHGMDPKRGVDPDSD